MRAPFEFVDDGAGSVALDSEDAGHDESGRPGQRRPLRWLAAVLVVLLAGGWALTRPRGAPPAVRVKTTPPTVSRSWEIGPPYPRSRPFSVCPRYAMCARSAALRASVSAAVVRQFPHARVRRVDTVERRWSGAVEPVLVRRVVTASVRGAAVRVVVAVYSGTAASVATSPRPRSERHSSVAHMSTEAAGFTIDVFWTGPHGAAVPRERLRRLAEEPAFVLAN